MIYCPEELSKRYAIGKRVVPVEVYAITPIYRCYCGLSPSYGRGRAHGS